MNIYKYTRNQKTSCSIPSLARVSVKSTWQKKYKQYNIDWRRACGTVISVVGGVVGDKVLVAWDPIAGQEKMEFEVDVTHPARKPLCGATPKCGGNKLDIVRKVSPYSDDYYSRCTKCSKCGEFWKALAKRCVIKNLTIGRTQGPGYMHDLKIKFDEAGCRFMLAVQKWINNEDVPTVEEHMNKYHKMIVEQQAEDPFAARRSAIKKIEHGQIVWSHSYNASRTEVSKEPAKAMVISKLTGRKPKYPGDTDIDILPDEQWWTELEGDERNVGVLVNLLFLNEPRERLVPSRFITKITREYEIEGFVEDLPQHKQHKTPEKPKTPPVRAVLARLKNRIELSPERKPNHWQSLKKHSPPIENAAVAKLKNGPLPRGWQVRQYAPGDEHLFPPPALGGKREYGTPFYHQLDSGVSMFGKPAFSLDEEKVLSRYAGWTEEDKKWCLEYYYHLRQQLMTYGGETVRGTGKRYFDQTLQKSIEKAIGDLETPAKFPSLQHIRDVVGGLNKRIEAFLQYP